MELACLFPLPGVIYKYSFRVLLTLDSKSVYHLGPGMTSHRDTRGHRAGHKLLTASFYVMVFRIPSVDQAWSARCHGIKLLQPQRSRKTVSVLVGF